MSEEIYIVFTTDKHHYHGSSDLIGSASDIDNAIEVIRDYIENEGRSDLSEDDLRNLRSIQQTQGYADIHTEFLLRKIPYKDNESN